MNRLFSFHHSLSPRRYLMCLLAVGLIGLGVVGIGAARDDPSAVVVDLVAELRVSVAGSNGHGSYEFVPATKVDQGQEIYYTVRIRNPGTEAISDVVVIQEMPTNTHYVAGSATGAGADIQFSVDGGKSFAEPEKLKIASAEPNFAATTDQYTHIRWHLQHPLAPKATVLARFRAIFE